MHITVDSRGGIATEGEKEWRKSLYYFFNILVIAIDFARYVRFRSQGHSGSQAHAHRSQHAININYHFQLLSDHPISPTQSL